MRTYNLRVDSALFDTIVTQARANERSINAQIVYMLRQFDVPKSYHSGVKPTPPAAKPAVRVNDTSLDDVDFDAIEDDGT